MRKNRNAAAVVETETEIAVENEGVSQENESVPPESESAPPEIAPPESALPASFVVPRFRLTLGGRGAKKAADGTITAAAEPTVELYKGPLDLSLLNTPSAQDLVVRLAAAAIIAALEKKLRARRREAFEVLLQKGVTEAEKIREALPPVTAEEIAEIVENILAEAPNPFAKPERKRRNHTLAPTQRLKAVAEGLKGKLAEMAKLAEQVSEALRNGDVETAQALQAQIVALGTEEGEGEG